MKRINLILALILPLLLIFSCEKKETATISDLEKLRQNNNEISYPTVQMDSLQAINSITKQKVQELLDLSTLYLDGNKRTTIDAAILKQINDYFLQPDSLTLKPLFHELEAKKVKSVKVHSLEVEKETKDHDTIDYAKFNIEYFDKSKKSLGKFDRTAKYTLVIPNKEDKEFKFFFKTFYDGVEKDTTSVGSTK